MEITNQAHSDLQNAPVELPQFTTATLKTYVPLIKGYIPSATQLVSLNGDILSREYIEVDASPQETFLEEINLGRYEERYKGSTYYLITTYYSQIKYRSNNIWISPTDPSYFLRWQKSTNTFRLELTYRDIEVSSFTWVRPPIKSATSSGSTTPIFYIPLTPSPYLALSANSGEAVKARITSNWPLKVYRGDTLIEDYSSILMVDPTLKIYIEDEPAITIPISITVQFYGQYAWTSQFPAYYTQPINLIHKVEETNKFLPPGKPNFPTNFWNTNPPKDSINDFFNRASVSPSYTATPTPQPSEYTG